MRDALLAERVAPILNLGTVFFLSIFILREREHEQGRGRERERERERERKRERNLSRLHAQHGAQCRAQSHNTEMMA